MMSRPRGRARDLLLGRAEELATDALGRLETAGDGITVLAVIAVRLDGAAVTSRGGIAFATDDGARARHLRHEDVRPGTIGLLLRVIRASVPEAP